MSKERFEDTFKKLETIVQKMENGDLALEDSMKLFEEGIRLSRLCSEKLNEIQKKVEILMKTDEGQTITRPFPMEEESSQID